MFGSIQKSLTFFVFSLSILFSLPAFAEDCERQRFNNVRPGQTYEAWIRVKKNKVCELVWSGGGSMFYEPIEVRNVPKSCSIKSNNYAMGLSCSQKGEFNFIYKIFILERDGNKGPITFNAKIIVSE